MNNTNHDYIFYVINTNVQMSRSMFTCLENRKDKQSTASAAKRACVSRRSSFLDMRSKWELSAQDAPVAGAPAVIMVETARGLSRHVTGTRNLGSHGEGTKAKIN